MNSLQNAMERYEASKRPSAGIVIPAAASLAHQPPSQEAVYTPHKIARSRMLRAMYERQPV